MTSQPGEHRDPESEPGGSSAGPGPHGSLDPVRSRASRPMKTLAIRELSAPAIQEAAVSGQIIGITNDRTLTAVLYPISQVLTEQLISENLARVIHNIDRGERELDTRGRPGEGNGAAEGSGLITLEELAASPPEGPSGVLRRARQVNLRDLSGKVLSEAARDNQAIALTTNRVLTGVVVPLPEQWVIQLVTQNLSRLLRSIDVGEREFTTRRDLPTLDDVVTGRPHDPSAE